MQSMVELFGTLGSILEVLAQEGGAPVGGAPVGGDGGAGAAGGGGGLGGLPGFLMPMLVIFLIFYILVFRPEGKKRKERQKMIAKVKKGDVILTTGGLIGRVWRVDETEVVVQIDKDKDIKGRFAKSAVFEVLKIADESQGAKRQGDEAVRELEERAKS